MNSRYRIYSAILAAGLAISLAGCAEKETSPESPITSTESTTSTTQSKPAESTSQSSTASAFESKPAESTSSTAEPTASSTESVPQSTASVPESKPAESKPTESKPTESKPEQSAPVSSSSKPTESKPTESKPEQSAPVSSSSKPTESKPAESTPAEGTPSEIGIVIVTSKFNHQKWSEKVRAIEAGEIEIDPSVSYSDKPSSVVIPEGAKGECFDQYGNPMPEDFDPSYGGYYDCDGCYQLTPEEYVQMMRDIEEAHKQIMDGTFNGSANMTDEDRAELDALLGI